MKTNHLTVEQCGIYNSFKDLLQSVKMAKKAKKRFISLMVRYHKDCKTEKDKSGYKKFYDFIYAKTESEFGPF